MVNGSHVIQLGVDLSNGKKLYMQLLSWLDAYRKKITKQIKSVSSIWIVVLTR